MFIDFTQGIISHPTSGGNQTFLTKTGQYVSFNAANGPTSYTIAHGGTNYVFTETQTVSNAWGPLAANVVYWLYWDINMQSGTRSFGITTVAPTYGSTQPTSPTEGLHWFDTNNELMYVYESGRFRLRLRVFAGTVINSTFAGMGVGYPSMPFAGTQVGLLTRTEVGRVVYDDEGLPIRRQNGQFFTTSDQLFVDGAAVTALRLESAVLTGTADENLAKYQVVKFTDFGRIGSATYSDIQQTTIAMVLEDLEWDETGTVVIQGVITNPTWNWTVVGQPLWVNDSGLLVPTDPHLYDPLNHPTQKPAIARVITPTSVYFDQGLGGRGDKGDPGDASSVYASPTVSGVTRLSVPAVDVGVPIAVGDNDPRLTQALLRTGGSMTGALILSGTPTTSLQATTKQYVDGSISSAVSAAITGIDLSGLVEKAGSTMTGALTLSGNPTASLHAASKAYVDTTAVAEAATAVATAVAALTAPYDISMMIGGMMQDFNEIVAGALSVRPVVIRHDVVHAARALVPPAALSEYSISTVESGVETVVGTLTFQPGSRTGVISFGSTFTLAAGAMIIVRVASAIPDITLKDVLVTFVGCAHLDQC